MFAVETVAHQPMGENVMTSFTQRLQNVRRRCCLEDQVIAQKAGMQLGRLGAILSGDVEPTERETQGLASALRTTSEWLAEGKMPVNAWPTFRGSGAYKAVAMFPAGPYRRASMVLRYTHEHYSGHLGFDDHLALWGSENREWLEKIIRGELLTDMLVHIIAETSGVPYAWIYLGQYALQGAGLKAANGEDVLSVLTKFTERWAKGRPRATKEELTAFKQVLDLTEDGRLMDELWKRMDPATMYNEES